MRRFVDHEKREISLSARSNINHALKDIIENDDARRFKQWIDSIFKENDGSAYVKNAEIDKNKKTIFYVKLMQHAVPFSDVDEHYEVGCVIRAIFKMKAFRCFQCLANYKNINLLTDWHFNIGGLLFHVLVEVFVDRKRLSVENDVVGYSSKSFLECVLDADVVEIESWLKAVPDLWKTVFKISNKDTGSLKHTPNYQRWHGVSNILSDSRVENSNLVLALLRSGLIDLNDVVSLLDMPGKTYCHEDTLSNAEKFVLQLNHSGGTNGTRYAL